VLSDHIILMMWSMSQNQPVQPSVYYLFGLLFRVSPLIFIYVLLSNFSSYSFIMYHPMTWKEVLRPFVIVTVNVLGLNLDSALRCPRGTTSVTQRQSCSLPTMLVFVFAWLYYCNTMFTGWSASLPSRPTEGRPFAAVGLIQLPESSITLHHCYKMAAMTCKCVRGLTADCIRSPLSAATAVNQFR